MLHIVIPLSGILCVFQAPCCQPSFCLFIMHSVKTVGEFHSPTFCSLFLSVLNLLEDKPPILKRLLNWYDCFSVITHCPPSLFSVRNNAVPTIPRQKAPQVRPQNDIAVVAGLWRSLSTLCISTMVVSRPLRLRSYPQEDIGSRNIILNRICVISERSPSIMISPFLSVVKLGRNRLLP
jgi:hypothetical protein